MEPELFAVTPQQSPRLAQWVERYRVHTAEASHPDLESERWCAWAQRHEAHGSTEIEALENLAVALGVPSWRG